MSPTPPIRIALAGLGGYAAHVREQILREEQAEHPAARLVAVCDPDLERHAAKATELRGRGIAVVRTFDALLAEPADAVWLPVPIDLHRPFTEAAVAAGRAVMCEKPAAGCVDDVDAMIAARDRAAVPVAVGFQDAYQPSVVALKRRLAAGEFGRPRAARVIGCWPRGARYFDRNDWAGRFRRNGAWVMDSPATNAMAHYLHLPLLLLGGGERGAAAPVAVAAELYRANPIENYDTCTIRYTLPGGVPLHVAMTHACAATVDPTITIDTDRARIRYASGRHVEVRMDDGRTETLPLSPRPVAHVLAALAAWVRHGPDAAAVGGTLEMARAHVVAVNAASEAAAVVDVPGEFVDVLPAAEHTTLRAIRDVVPALEACCARDALLHETGLVPWSVPAGTRSIDRYTHFAGPAQAAVAAAAPAAKPGATTRSRLSGSCTAG